jgi:hypothetical protein
MTPATATIHTEETASAPRRGAQTQRGAMLRRLMLLVPLCIVIAPQAQATTAINLSLAELSDSANVVVIGEVVQSQSYWDGGVILTDSTLSVIDCLKGACGQDVVVTTIGGEVGSIAQAVIGESSYRPGEQVMAFLRTQPDGRLQTVGMAQGLFHIQEVGGMYVARADLSGLVLVDGPGQPATEGLDGVYRLADLISSVRYHAPALPLRPDELPQMLSTGG